MYITLQAMAASSPTKEGGAQEISSEWIKVIAESIGISATAEDGYKYLAEDVTFRYPVIFQLEIYLTPVLKMYPQKNKAFEAALLYYAHYTLYN